MEPEGSLTHSEEPATCPYSEIALAPKQAKYTTGHCSYLYFLLLKCDTHHYQQIYRIILIPRLQYKTATSSL